MDVLVLGNGFDLAHNLPTTYLCFLKATEFIYNQKRINALTIGQVFDSIKDECKEIKNSYIAYKSVYDNHVLNQDELFKIKELCEKNEWWQYFQKTYNKSVGWIDFEKEIASVINKINHMIEKHSNPDYSFDLQRFETLIAAYFQFFVEHKEKYTAIIHYNYVDML